MQVNPQGTPTHNSLLEAKSYEDLYGILSGIVFLYSRNPLYGHPLNTDTSLLRTVCSVPGESSYIFSKFNPLNTDTR